MLTPHKAVLIATVTNHRSKVEGAAQNLPLPNETPEGINQSNPRLPNLITDVENQKVLRDHQDELLRNQEESPLAVSFALDPIQKATELTPFFVTSRRQIIIIKLPEKEIIRMRLFCWCSHRQLQSLKLTMFKNTLPIGKGRNTMEADCWRCWCYYNMKTANVLKSDRFWFLNFLRSVSEWLCTSRILYRGHENSKPADTRDDDMCQYFVIDWFDLNPSTIHKTKEIASEM